MLNQLHKNPYNRRGNALDNYDTFTFPDLKVKLACFYVLGFAMFYRLFSFYFVHVDKLYRN